MKQRSNMCYEKWCQEGEWGTIYHPWVHCVWPYFLALFLPIQASSSTWHRHCWMSAMPPPRHFLCHQSTVRRAAVGMMENKAFSGRMEVYVFHKFWVLLSVQVCHGSVKKCMLIVHCQFDYDVLGSCRDYGGFLSSFYIQQSPSLLFTQHLWRTDADRDPVFSAFTNETAESFLGGGVWHGR